MANKVQAVEEELAAIEREIQSGEARLKALRVDREAFLLVLHRLRGKSPEHHPELPTLNTNGHAERGAITKAVLAVVSQSSTAMTTREVTTALLRRGIRPKGDEKNFGVTVAKSLKRLSKKQLMEHRDGRSVSYSGRK